MTDEPNPLDDPEPLPDPEEGEALPEEPALPDLPSDEAAEPAAEAGEGAAAAKKKPLGFPKGKGGPKPLPKLGKIGKGPKGPAAKGNVDAAPAGKPAKEPKPPKPPKPRRARKPGGGKRLMIAALLLVAAGVGGFFLRHPALYAWNLGRLVSDDAESVASARTSMSGMSEFALTRLEQDCASPYPGLRTRAVRAFGRWGQPQAVAAAMSCAQSPEPALRRAGILALGDLVRSGEGDAPQSATDRLFELLGAHDRPDDQRLLLVDQLFAAAPDASRDADLARRIVEHLADHAKYLRGTVVEEAHQIGSTLVLADFEDRDARVRRLVLEGVVDRLDERAAIPVLLRGIDPSQVDARNPNALWIPYVSIDRLRRLTRQDLAYDPYQPGAGDFARWRDWWEQNQHRY